MTKYSGDVVCPFCGTKSKEHSLKREWIHGLQLVNELECINCGYKFRLYYGEKTDGTPFSYIIPKILKNPRIKER